MTCAYQNMDVMQPVPQSYIASVSKEHAHSSLSMPEILPVEVLILDQNTSRHLSELASKSKYFQIIFITQGSCRSTVDFDENEINPQNIGFTRPGQISHLRMKNGARGYLLRFTSDFMFTSVEKSALINQGTFARFSYLPTLNIDEDIKREMTQILDGIAREFFAFSLLKPQAYRLEVISGLLKVFLVYLSTIVYDKSEIKEPVKNRLVESFFSLLELHYKTLKNTSDYAAALNVTPNYLSELLKKLTGFTASHYIQQRILLEAKRLIVYSDTSMKEVAYKLGYDDMAHFSRFFKKTSGECFTEFKKKIIIKF